MSEDTEATSDCEVSYVSDFVKLDQIEITPYNESKNVLNQLDDPTDSNQDITENVPLKKQYALSALNSLSLYSPEQLNSEWLQKKHKIEQITDLEMRKALLHSYR